MKGSRKLELEGKKSKNQGFWLWNCNRNLIYDSINSTLAQIPASPVEKRVYSNFFHWCLLSENDSSIESLCITKWKWWGPKLRSQFWETSGRLWWGSNPRGENLKIIDKLGNKCRLLLTVKRQTIFNAGEILFFS
jgi:hypothetical protein